MAIEPDEREIAVLSLEARHRGYRGQTVAGEQQRSFCLRRCVGNNAITIEQAIHLAAGRRRGIDHHRPGCARNREARHRLVQVPRSHDEIEWLVVHDKPDWRIVGQF
jgi:hypothetical protein